MSGFLTGPKVHLRALERSDLGRCAAWMNDPEITQYLLTGRFAINAAKQEEWFARMNQGEHHAILAIALNEGGDHIGNCGLHDIDWVDRFATAGIAIGEKSLWGRGFGTEAMELLLSYAFDVINLDRVELSVYEHNVRAHKSYVRLGFVEEGRLRKRRFKGGTWRDEILMALRRDERKPG